MDAHTDDRRAPGIRRVGLATLVEICGRAPGVPAFEAESIEVSGRGMHVRTKYLPEVSAPLVLRFDHNGREVVVEGSVAWRRETEGGGDFGIRFTALDSNSVSVLRQLSAQEQQSPEDVADLADEEAFVATPGAPVKLHLGGLAAPMKARVFEGTSRKVHVGSQLEFLKLGRSLELEELDGGQKRGAHIESVSVTLDPESQIPQLVVHLRYEGAEVTPGPSVVDNSPREASGSKRGAAQGSALAFSPSSASHGHPASLQGEVEDNDFREVEPSAEDEAVLAAEAQFKHRVTELVSTTRATLVDWGARAREITGSVGARAAVALGELTQRGKESARTQRSRATRRTSSTPTSISSGDPRPQQPRRLRPQHPQARQVQSAAYLRSPKFLAAAGGALCVFIAGAYLLASDGEKPEASLPLPPLQQPAALQTTTEASAQAQNLPAQAGGVAAAAGELPGGLGELEALPPGQFPPPAKLNGNPASNGAEGAIAEVPLFGKTEMATAEAAPVEPSRSAGIDELSLAKDQAFSDGELSAAAPPKKEEALESQGQTEWQVGRMHLPVIHRLRLDSPGTALQPTKTANGFTLLVPGRKLKESGSHIAGRDERIADVRVSNTPAGAKVTFRFRGEVPGYKARLRNDFLEIFINSAAKGK